VGTITAARLLGRVLRAAGVTGVYGEPAGGLHVVPVEDADVAELLAVAHRRVHRRGAVPHRGGVLGSGEVRALDDPADLPAAVGWLADGGALRLGFDLDQPTADVVPPAAPAVTWAEPPDELVAALAAAERPVVLAGPGVVDAGAVPGLHAIAAGAAVGVLNTWGAKGVFDWRSRHHLATAGLQARDFELGGLAGADVVLTTGLDPLESPTELLARTGDRLVDITPAALDPLSERWSRPSRSIEKPPLFAGLAAVTQEGWAATTSPMPPSLVTRHYGLVGSGGGMVAADPGTAGYWVARTFATTELGGVQVPADPQLASFAAACALVGRLADPGRPVLAVTEAPPHAVLEAARSLGVPVPVEVWAPDGEALDADAHQARLREVVGAEESTVVTIATEPTQLARMVEVAGPVIAWGGL
jgi:hypothetical protein